MNPMISTSQMLLVIQSPPHRVLTQSTTTFQRPPWLLEGQSSHSASMKPGGGPTQFTLPYVVLGLLAARRRMTPAAANALPAASSNQVAGSHRGESLPGPPPVDGAATAGVPPPAPPKGVGAAGAAVDATGEAVGGAAVVVATGVPGVPLGAGVSGGALAQPWMETLLVSIVTSPFRARALPDTLAPFCRAMLVSARIFPTNLVVVPRVAELPTCQNTLQPEPLLIMTTDESLAVVSVVPIWKMKTAALLPPASSVNCPVNPADDERQ